jgi:DNA-directed RNA polymerase specialized sigma24 family protein
VSPVPTDQADLLRRLTARRESMDSQWRDAIRAAVAEGGSLREVAELAGVTHSAVRIIAHGRGKS